ncbi:MAG: hypothetical protein NC212_00700 [Staphylococcus sp.]|nr:hypothetical protein [Staphylococcus sp.]
MINLNRYAIRLTALVTSTLFLIISLPSCSRCSDIVSSAKQEKVSVKVKDHKAYSLGEEHAQQLLMNADDEDKVQDNLLEIQARISNIRSKLGAQSAADYERGFTDYLKANNDSLAKIIF